MEDDNTIHVMFDGTSMGLMTEPEKKDKEAKAKIQTKIHKYDDRRILLDLNDNTQKKFLNSKVKDLNQDGGGGVKRKANTSNQASKQTKNYYEY